MAFIGDNLLTTSSKIIYHGEIPDADEELVVLTCLRLLHLAFRSLQNSVTEPSYAVERWLP